MADLASKRQLHGHQKAADFLCLLHTDKHVCAFMVTAICVLQADGRVHAYLAPQTVQRGAGLLPPPVLAAWLTEFGSSGHDGLSLQHCLWVRLGGETSP